MPDNAEPSAEVPAAAKPATKARRPAKRKAATAPANPSAPNGLAARKHPVRDPAFGKDWWQRGVVYQVYPRASPTRTATGSATCPGSSPSSTTSRHGAVARHRRDLAVADLPVARPRRRLRRQRLRRDRPDLRHARRLRPPGRRSPSAGNPADPRPRDEPHQLPPRWFEESRREPQRPVRRLVPVARRPAGAVGRKGRPNNWVSFFGGSAWTWDEVRGQFYLHTFLPEQPDLNWRNPAVEAAQLAMVRGWLERGVDGFRLDVFNVFLKHPELLSNPRRGRAAGPGSARSTSTTATSPTSSSSWPSSGRSSTRIRNGSRSASSSTAIPSAPRASAPRATWCSTGSSSRRRGPPRPSRRSTDSASASSGRTAGRRSSCRTTTSRGTRQPPGAGRRRRDERRRARRPPRSCCWPCAARRSSTTARRSGCSTSRSRADEIVDPPATRRPPDPAPRSVVEPRPVPDADGLDRWARTADSRPAGRGSGSATTPSPECRRRGRRSRVRPRRLPQAALAAAASPGAPGRRVPAAPSRSDDVLACERSTDGETIIVAVNFAATPRSLRIRTVKRWKTLLDTHEPAQAESSGATS